MSIYTSYLESIRTIAIPNKYTNTYVALITNAVKRQQSFSNQTPYNIRKTIKIVLGSAERHHILPRSFRLGGEVDDANLVFLTSREHFVAHRLLTKMFMSKFKSKMYCAMHRLMHNHTNKTVIANNSRIRLKINQDAAIAKQGVGNGMYGRNHTLETKALIAAVHKGKTVSDDCKELMRQNNLGSKNNMHGKNHTTATRLKMVESQSKVDRTKENNSFYGCEHSDTTKDKMSAARKSYNAKNQQTCPYCNKSADPNNFKRWHGANCKTKIIQERLG